jgi:RimJ/RimL family protein N-acetyltransferase
MPVSDIATTVAALRATRIEGLCVNLVPYAAEHAAKVVRLRNFPDVRHFLNQSSVSTIESQAAWHASYLQRRDDIFWMIEDKVGRTLGCNRLYDISAQRLEKGSLIVDPDLARGGPFALEADLLALECAFRRLAVASVITRTMPDNLKMQSMNARLGFVPQLVATGQEARDERGLHLFELRPERFKPAAFAKLIQYWSKRNEH